VQKTKGVQVLRCYDILAVRPTNQDLFAKACTELEVDIITLDMTRRVPFSFRREPVGKAIERGLMFEINYSHALKGTCAASSNTVSHPVVAEGQLTRKTRR